MVAYAVPGELGLAVMRVVYSVIYQQVPVDDGRGLLHGGRSLPGIPALNHRSPFFLRLVGLGARERSNNPLPFFVLRNEDSKADIERFAHCM